MTNSPMPPNAEVIAVVKSIVEVVAELKASGHRDTRPVERDAGGRLPGEPGYGTSAMTDPVTARDGPVTNAREDGWWREFADVVAKRIGEELRSLPGSGFGGGGQVVVLGGGDDRHGGEQTKQPQQPQRPTWAGVGGMLARSLAPRLTDTWMRVSGGQREIDSRSGLSEWLDRRGRVGERIADAGRSLGVFAPRRPEPAQQPTAGGVGLPDGVGMIRIADLPEGTDRLARDGQPISVVIVEDRTRRTEATGTGGGGLPGPLADGVKQAERERVEADGAKKPPVKAIPIAEETVPNAPVKPGNLGVRAAIGMMAKAQKEREEAEEGQEVDSRAGYRSRVARDRIKQAGGSKQWANAMDWVGKRGKVGRGLAGIGRAIGRGVGRLGKKVGGKLVGRVGGAIAGRGAGMAAGAAAGSVVPGIGTAVGAVVGSAIAGGGGDKNKGGGLGEQAKQASLGLAGVALAAVKFADAAEESSRKVLAANRVFADVSAMQAKLKLEADIFEMQRGRRVGDALGESTAFLQQTDQDLRTNTEDLKIFMQKIENYGAAIVNVLASAVIEPLNDIAAWANRMAGTQRGGEVTFGEAARNNALREGARVVDDGKDDDARRRMDAARPPGN
jgi:hypothetical protein